MQGVEKYQNSELQIMYFVSSVSNYNYPSRNMDIRYVFISK